MASRGARIRQRGSKLLTDIQKDLRRELANDLREGAREVVKELYDRSPAWRGKFRERWYTQLEGRSNRVFVGNGVPQIPANLKKGNLTILVGNSSPYATVAMDLEPGVFTRPTPSPIKEEVRTGTRVDGIRGSVIEGKGGAISTAKEFWYQDFMYGGGFDAAFKLGTRTGTIKPLI